MSVATDFAADVDVGQPESRKSARLTAFIDIETASQPAWLARQAVNAGVEPGPDTVLWTREHASDGATSPFSGQIVCWAIAIDEHETVWSMVSDNELELLKAFRDQLNELRPVKLVAHNGHGFDFPFIRCRALRADLPTLARGFWQDKPWGTRLIDTAEPSWAPRPRRTERGWEYSLDALADLLGITRVHTLAGADVPRAWYERRWDEIEAHCRDDVRTLRAVYPKLAAGRAT